MGRIIRTALALSVAGGLSSALAQDPGDARPSGRLTRLCLSTPFADRIEGVTREGEIQLASGRLVRLAGIRRPAEPVFAAQAAAFLESQRGSPVETAAVRTQPDRWERWPAVVTVTGETGPIDLGRSLVAAGLALVDAGEEDALCQPDLLATERRAREAELGLWREERYKPLDASDLDRLLAMAGHFAVVEGRVWSVSERSERTYLNFGADWWKNLTITIPKRTWRRMVEGGISAARLRGRRVRVRGIVEQGSGPQITMTAPEMLEQLNEGAATRR